MAKAEASVEELVGMIERGELRLPEMQRRYVWRSPRVRDLLDSLYRGYPLPGRCTCLSVLLWERCDEIAAYAGCPSDPALWRLAISSLSHRLREEGPTQVTLQPTKVGREKWKRLMLA